MKIKGLYGENLSIYEWAERLGVTVDLLYLCLEAGKSIAEIHVLLGKPYTPPKTRKPRESAQMIRTKERMAILLEMSEITDRVTAIDDITVERVGTHSLHGVYYNGSMLGVYNYKDGSLRLSGGQGIPLWSLEWEDAKVIQGPDGRWHPHPDTRRRILLKAIRAENEADNIAGVFDTNERAKETRENTRQTYEGFGKRYTCAEWERVLGVSHTTLWRALQRGESIEDFAKRKGIK